MVADEQTSRRLPVVICPYVYEHEFDEVRETFSVGTPETDHIEFFMWHDRDRIGPERAFENCWNQFPDRDIVIVHTDMAPLPEESPARWFDELCRYQQELPSAGMIACNLFYPRGTDDEPRHVQCAGGLFEAGEVSHIAGPVSVSGEPGSVASQQLDHVREVPWVTFGGVLIRREVIDECGSIDGRYEWAYVMDVDYCFEARSRGFRLFQVPVALIHHENRTTRSVVSGPSELQDRTAVNMARFREKWTERAVDIPTVAPVWRARPDRIGGPGTDGVGQARGIVVVGMHHSGTSLAAELLVEPRFVSARGDEVVEAGPGESAGLHERWSIIDLNDRVLHEAGGRWDAPPPAEVVAGLAHRFDRELSSTLERIGEAGDAPSILNDPRIAVLGPLWAQHVRNLARVLTVRNPLESARSLRLRDQMPTHVGLALWEVYTTRVLAELNGSRVHVWPYTDLIDRAAAADLVGGVIEDLDPAAQLTLRVDTATENRDLARNRATDKELHAHMTAAQRRLWSYLSSLEPGPSEMDVPDGLVESSRRAELVVHEHTLDRGRVATLRSERDALRQAHIEAMSVAERVAPLELQVNSLRAASGDLEGQLQAIRDSRTWRVGQSLSRAVRWRPRRDAG